MELTSTNASQRALYRQGLALYAVERSWLTVQPSLQCKAGG